jgi:hypothetical protein
MSLILNSGFTLGPGFTADAGYTPPPLTVISLNAYPSNANEGAVINIQPIWQNANGQTVYWTVKYGADVNSSNFTTSSGTFVVSGSSSNFYVSTIEDDVTQGHDWTFGIKLGTTAGGNDLWDSSNNLVTIHDTSLTPGNGVFDGSSWLEVAGGEQFILGSTWTIEFSINPNDISLHAQGGIWGIMNQVGWANQQAISIALAGGLLIVGGGFDGSATGFPEPATGRWTHIAVVNDGGDVSVFYNGIRQPEQQHGPGNRGTFAYINTATLFIGRLTPIYGGTIPAKIANVRITDQALYTAGDFTPNVIPTRIPGHTRLLWKPTIGSLTTDTGDYASSITNTGTGVTYSTATVALSAIPRNSYGFNGTNSYITVANTTTDWNLGNSYTIEWWSNAAVQSNASTSILTVMSQQDNDNCIDIFYYNGNLNLFNGQVNTPEPPINVWTHVIVTSIGGRVTITYNGVKQYDANPGRSASNSSLPLIIGKRGYNDFQYFNGKLAGIRIYFLYSDTIQNMLTLTDSTPTDTSGRAHVITNNAITTAVDGYY